METLIDNDQKVFMLVGDMSRKVFCNLRDVSACLNSFDDQDEVKIYFFWNDGQRKHVTRKKINEWLTANQIESQLIPILK